jgi:hypothetical protein
MDELAKGPRPPDHDEVDVSHQASMISGKLPREQSTSVSAAESLRRCALFFLCCAERACRFGHGWCNAAAGSARDLSYRLALLGLLVRWKNPHAQRYGYICLKTAHRNAVPRCRVASFVVWGSGRSPLHSAWRPTEPVAPSAPLSSNTRTWKPQLRPHTTDNVTR